MIDDFYNIEEFYRRYISNWFKALNKKNIHYSFNLNRIHYIRFFKG